MLSKLSIKLLIIILMASISLTGCKTMNSKQEGSDQASGQTGAILGGLLGAAIGSRKSGKKAAKYALIGALLGGAVGYFGPKLYRSLSKEDQKTHDATREKVLRQVPVGGSMAWDNPDNRSGANVSLLNSYRDNKGKDCKIIKETIYVNGKQETVDSNLCLDVSEDRYKVVSN